MTPPRPSPGQRSRSDGADRLGILSVNPRGFGFVSSLGDVGDDVFIPPDALGGAMHGDTVRIHFHLGSAGQGWNVTVTDVTTGRSGTIVLNSKYGPLLGVQHSADRQRARLGPRGRHA